jgi:hypothetical protein
MIKLQNAYNLGNHTAHLAVDAIAGSPSLKVLAEIEAL